MSSGPPAKEKDGLRAYYKAKIEEYEIAVRDKTQNLRRLEAQRNELNSKGEREFFFVHNENKTQLCQPKGHEGREPVTRRLRVASRAIFARSVDGVF